jgi:predicted phosphohydrolase
MQKTSCAKGLWMKIFAISDLHLSFEVDKPMDIFGQSWTDHPGRIKEHWSKLVRDDDLVLIPGDISWAMRLDEAKQDFAFVDELPGRKIIIKGNHDYWWASINKVKKFVPDTIIPLQNTSFVCKNVGIAGARLWIDPDLNLEKATADDKKIWDRELMRLKYSLDALPDGLDTKIIMTHYPPISLEGKPGKAVEIASSYGCDIWVFGHMHLGSFDYDGFNRTIDGTRYEFVSADYLDFCPKLVLDGS